MKFYGIKKIDDTQIARTVFTGVGCEAFAYFPESSESDYRVVAEHMGILPEQMVRIDQKHTAKIVCVTADDKGRGVVREGFSEPFDGMITNEKGIMLCTVEADCVPVYILDPVKGAIGMVHSGWRGTAEKIAGNAIRLMREKYGCNPKDIICATGPCICEKCYEVSADLKDEFSKKFTADQLDIFFKECGREGKYILDLKEAIRITLEEECVIRENILDSGFCTYHEDLFWSYRKTQKKTGRMLTGILMK